MKLSSQLQTQITQIISKFLEGNYTIYLFGSYAKGTATKFSDIDIAIDLGRPLDTKVWSLLDEAFSESDILQKVDLVDIHRAKESFKKIILEEGVEL